MTSATDGVDPGRPSWGLPTYTGGVTMVQVAWATFGLLAAALFGSFFYLGARIDSLSDRIDSLSDRIDSLSDRIDGRIDSLSDRIDGRINSLSHSMDALAADLRAEIRHLSDRIDTHLREEHGLG